MILEIFGSVKVHISGAVAGRPMPAAGSTRKMHGADFEGLKSHIRNLQF